MKIQIESRVRENLNRVENLIDIYVKHFQGKG